MPFDVKEFKTYTAALPINFYGEEIVVTYRPADVSDPQKRDQRAKRYQEARAALFNGANDGDLPADDPAVEATRQHDRLTWAEVDRPLVEMACQMMTGWDLSYNGKPLPATPASFKKWNLPPSLAQAIVTAISEDVETLGSRSRAYQQASQ